MREVVAERLVTAAGRPKLLETLRSELRSKRPSRRSFAAFATGRLFPGEDPRPLLLHVSSKISVNADETMVQMLVRNKRRRTEADPVRVEIKVRDSLDRNIEIIGDSTSEIIL